MKSLFIDLLADYIGHFGFLLMIALAVVNVAKKNRKNKNAVRTLVKNQNSNLNEPVSLHPEINPALCVGCGSCVNACPEGEILQLINHKSSLVSPTKCVGHGACEQSCPFGAIDLVFGTKTRGMEIPRISPDFETNIPGLYIAGELGGMGLIRNAVKQGRLAAYHAISKLKNVKRTTDVDIFIVGAGAAGFSATLAAKEHHCTYRVIDQNTFGGTIYNFPRQKVVTSHPLDLSLAGQVKFKSNIVQKEKLLEIFSQIVERNQLVISEKENFISLKKLGNDIFSIETSKGVYTAKKVILCMGVRGTPRRLGLANEDLPKVAYSLIDPSDYQNSAIAIVGGGNAGLEATQYLSKQSLKNKVHLIVRGGPEDAFSRANEQNQKLIRELEKKKQITIHYNSAVQTIEKDFILVKKFSHDLKLQNNFLFIFTGAEVPFKFLMSLGIIIDKSYGEKRKLSMAQY
ncbi:MAG: hypothetical protein A2X86_20885 [Bdellovibrionales bacterium GWA2_49_15]|nr:MAG: hypothetical protein A2X86_20885 [Bdellovibrionales bacterium GWA2_49_15]HAZ13145.1 4Fe-4S ferredoxin [Bdellovibrionales bacterium]